MIPERLAQARKVNPNMKVTCHPLWWNDTAGICLNINTNGMGLFEPLIIGKREYRKVITSIQGGGTFLTGGYIIEVMAGERPKIWKKASAP